MKIRLRMDVSDGWTGAEIEIEAEGDGEKAILHLLSKYDQLSVHRTTNIHDSYKLTDKVFLRPVQQDTAKP